jgi:dTMP kinase
MSRFIVIEGLDGAGTTTQTRRLVAWLGEQGVSAVETREPTRGPVGRIIRDVLAEAQGAPPMEVLPWLFAADRADHLHREVEPALAAGRWVVSDRYYHSSLAYQSLTLPLDQVRALNAGFRVPDLTLFVDVDVDECLRRIAARAHSTGEAREIFERRDRMDAIHVSYERVIAVLHVAGQPIVTVDGHQSEDAVARAIDDEVEALLP